MDCLSDEGIEYFLRGELSAQQMQEASDHITECSHCAVRARKAKDSAKLARIAASDPTNHKYTWS